MQTTQETTTKGTTRQRAVKRKIKKVVGGDALGKRKEKEHWLDISKHPCSLDDEQEIQLLHYLAQSYTLIK